MIHLDTHVVVWLYAGDLGRLSTTARARMDTTPPAISPAVTLELAVLQEIGRIDASASDIVSRLAEVIGLSTDPTPFGAVVAHATALTWTRDPFDRLIAAQSLAAGAPLITKDRRMRDRLPTAIW